MVKCKITNVVSEKILTINSITPYVAATTQKKVIKPLNDDPYIGMLETPVTSAPIVVNYLSNLPAYRIGVTPLQRGVEIGLTHGFFLPGPFIKLGPLRMLRAQLKLL